MNRDEYSAIANLRPDVSLDLSKDYCQIYTVPSMDQRTLLYGYTVERQTFHVYMQDAMIHRVIYTAHHGLLDYLCSQRFGNAAVLAPDKRIYPERTDFNFARLLKRKGVYLSFTTYPPGVDEPVPSHRGHFHGLTYADFDTTDHQNRARGQDS